MSLEILYDTWFKKSVYENKKIKIQDITVAQMDGCSYSYHGTVKEGDVYHI